MNKSAGNKPVILILICYSRRPKNKVINNF
jgi:hypothetical protein